jgi:hypothetical protein
MPALTNLYKQVKSNAQWRNRYRINISLSRKVAKSMPLVHVLGRAKHVRLSQIILEKPYPKLKTSASHGSANTLYTEAKWSLPPSLYFYAGRAAPSGRYGYMALAFDKSCEAIQQGSATPFDTGGLAHGYILTNLADDVAAKDFVAKSLISLDKWRCGFSKYLAAYFQSPSDHFAGRPIQLDPEELHDPNNTWRAWTFEVRFHDNQKIADCIKWCAPKRLREGIRRTIISLPPFHPLHSFMGRAIIHGNREKPIKVMEGWIRNQLKI